MGRDGDRSAAVVSFGNHNGSLSRILGKNGIQIFTCSEDMPGLIHLSRELELDGCMDERSNSVKVVGKLGLARAVVLEVARSVGIGILSTAESGALADIVQVDLSVVIHCHEALAHTAEGALCGSQIGIVQKSQAVHLGEEVDEHGGG